MPIAADSNEKELLLLLKQGSQYAFEQLYLAYSKRIFGNIIRLVRSTDTAQELLQDIFLKLWNNREQIDPDQSFRSWLFRIAENTAYDFFRRAARDEKIKRELLKAAVSMYHHVEEALYTKENVHIIQSAIEALPAQRKKVFHLCKIDGRSYEDVSAQLGISTSTISDHIVKATRFIREYLSRNQELAPCLVAMILLSEKVS
jgi:RNA polymerase sigma-70 factor (ECF subfamily)